MSVDTRGRSSSASSERGGSSSRGSSARQMALSADNGSSDSAAPSYSPSPSPALTAYSYASDVSHLSDLDSLSLDDWGNEFRRSTAMSDAANMTLRPRAGPHVQSGATTPIVETPNELSVGKLSGKGSAWALGADQSRTPGLAAEDDTDAVLNGDAADSFDLVDEDEKDMHANGIPAARGWKLNALQSDTIEFKQKVIAMFSKELCLPGWTEHDVAAELWPLSPELLRLKRISGAFSNAVFFVWYEHPETRDAPRLPVPPTMLLRVYGASTGTLLSRRGELLILHTLSSLYGIGPHILGTFANGRVEEHFKCEPIGIDGMRDLGSREQSITKEGHLRVKGVEGTAQWVARRMRELHEVPLEVMKTVLEQGDLHAPSGKGFGQGIENHIMASSHRPRKMVKTPRGTPGHGHIDVPVLPDAARALRDSPAPMLEGETDGTSLAKVAATAAHEQEMSNAPEACSRPYSLERNGSVASFDSLATSFESHASFSSDRGASRSPVVQGKQTSTESYFPPQGETAMARSPTVTRHNTPSVASGSSHRPYPGVWRRLKRWSREAAKVMQNFNDFAQSDEGKFACSIALQGAPAGANINDPRSINSDMLANTTGNLCTTLLCIVAIDFPRLMHEFDAYKRFIRDWERTHGQSRRVFSHNDSQYGNLLRVIESEEQSAPAAPAPRNQAELLRDREGGLDGQSSRRSSPASFTTRRRSKMQPHQQIVVIDFEYASPNPRGYDIANHFHEWRANYHHPSLAWSLTHHGAYPTEQERRKWLRAYVEQGRLLRMRGAAKGPPPLETPTEFSLGPPAFPIGTPIAARPPSIPPSRADSSMEPSLTPFLCGQTSPLSPSLGAGSFSPTASPQITPLARLDASIEREVDRLEREVNMWSPAAHAVWSLWGMVFGGEEIELVITKAKKIVAGAGPLQNLSKDDPKLAELAQQRAVEAGAEEPFDNLRYALNRVELFRYEIQALGIEVHL